MLEGSGTLKCQICHDSFKPSTIHRNYTLVTCKACHHTFCLKHSVTRETKRFLDAIVKDLRPLEGTPGTETQFHHQQAFNAVKACLCFETKIPGQLLTSTETLTPSQMASWLKKIDQVIAQRLPSVRDHFPAALCPFCTLEYMDSDTLLAYCLLELKKNYPHLSMDEFMQHLVYTFKQHYQTLEAFKTQLKGEM